MLIFEHLWDTPSPIFRGNRWRGGVRRRRGRSLTGGLVLSHLSRPLLQLIHTHPTLEDQPPQLSDTHQHKHVNTYNENNNYRICIYILDINLTVLGQSGRRLLLCAAGVCAPPSQTGSPFLKSPAPHSAGRGPEGHS